MRQTLLQTLGNITEQKEQIPANQKEQTWVGRPGGSNI